MPRIHELTQFLGKKTLWLMVMGVFTGITLFGIEIFFAQTIDVFLQAIGGTPVESIARSFLITWLPLNGFTSVLVLLGTLGAIRGLLQCAQVYFPSLTAEEQRFVHRGRVLHWAFRSHSANSGEIMTLFSDTTSGAATAILSVQALAALIPVALLLWVGLLQIAMMPTLIVTGCLALLALGLKALDSITQRAGVQVAREGAAINANVLANIKNLLLMQIYGTEAKEANRVEASLANYYRHSHLQLVLMSAKYAIPQIFGVVLICIITAAALQGPDRLPAGVLIAYFYLFVRFVQNVSEILRQLSFIEYYKPHLVRMFGWWKQNGQAAQALRLAVPSAQVPPLLTGPGGTGWRLKEVEFRYPDAAAPVLQKLSAEIAPGETFVIVGPSGSGKSTLVSLLLGNLQPSSGDVKLVVKDEKGTENFPLAEVRARFLKTVGYVGPESFLLAGTILENLTYGLDQMPNPAQIERALQTAECQFVFELPKGTAHLISEQGQGLSAGQKQRLALARALLRNPTTLILDEATANLDLETEQRLVNTLKKLKHKMTIIGVTHRQALLEIADHTLRLEESTQTAGGPRPRIPAKTL
ncbi:MAG: ATP-binding cassette domain-containing protein [Bacteriovoracia bacterium]